MGKRRPTMAAMGTQTALLIECKDLCAKRGGESTLVIEQLVYSF